MMIRPLLVGVQIRWAAHTYIIQEHTQLIQII